MLYLYIVALSGALLYQDSHIESLYTVNYILCFIIVLAFHAGANLINTYYDFQTGVDQVATADDRTLVDKTVLPSTVLKTALGCFAVGLSAALKGLTIAPFDDATPALALLGLSMGLSFFYTANPLNLKGLGLGDFTIFMCFGPLLMSGVCLATCGKLVTAVL